MNTVAVIGGFTAVFAAAMGLAANDIKRVLAFSTVSQLGYMFLALGVGAPGVAMFHLFNHAFFKCLLFLGAGSMHHSVHTFDMRYMGGIRRWMPITYLTTLAGGLSLAGIFPLAGFWSKDEILSMAWSGAHAANSGVSQLVFWLALAAAFMTAFLRLPAHHHVIPRRVPRRHRRGAGRRAHTGRGAPPRTPAGVSTRDGAAAHRAGGGFAVGSGFVANSLVALGPVPAHWFSHLLHEDAPDFNIAIALTSTVVAVTGIGLAVLVYGTRTISFDGLGRFWRFGHRLLVQRFYPRCALRGLHRPPRALPRAVPRLRLVSTGESWTAWPTWRAGWGATADAPSHSCRQAKCRCTAWGFRWARRSYSSST